jgi:Tfp pilus assembly protein PilV
VAPKILIGISIGLLALSLLLGFLNTGKLKSLRNDVTTNISEKENAMRLRAASDRKLKAREKEFTEATSRATAAEEKANSAEANLTKAQNERAELEAKLQASESQVTDLQKRVADATVGGTAGAEGAAPNDLKSQLDDAKKQLEAAEQEKSVLADKVRTAQDRVARMEEEKKRRESGANVPGVHGIVLAVNQAYNFVVLSVGDRQGVVTNSEMLVMREGVLIGKIRISSVEPTTSIGDIISTSLPRGVQVQPGDTVIYAGTTNS